MTGECQKRHHSPRYSKSWSCPDCEAGVKASPLMAAFAARDAGMARAAGARPDERTRVAAAIRQLAATGRPFSANDARSIHGVKGGVVGATFTALKNEGVIKACGDVTSTDKATHGHRIFKWQGVAA